MSCDLTCTNSLIDISGLCDIGDVADVISQNPYWIQMNVPEHLSIPEQKPDMEEINSITVSVDIFRKEVIVVPDSISSNLEGKYTTGRKLIIEGQLCQKVMYTAEEDVQSVHGAEFYVPFSAYIVLPALMYNPTTKKFDIDPLDVEFQVNACIEDVVVKMMNEREILKQVTMLLYAVPNLSAQI